MLAKLTLINQRDEILSIYEKKFLSKVDVYGKLHFDICIMVNYYLIYFNKYFQIKIKNITYFTYYKIQ